MSNRPSGLPIILLTGASGIIGRHMISSFRDDAYIYALARRSQKSVGISIHKNVNWIRLDIANSESVSRVFDEIAESGGADFVIHMAGYYDFENTDHPEFERTNVNGTRLVLENTHKLNIKRFIFTSSITVTKFKTAADVITEDSPANATFPYARSKRKGEEMVKEFSSQFPCTIVRLAAVFSDWCEYAPLYMFLSTWLSTKWKARILAGRGLSSIPYIHIRNLTSFLASLIRMTESQSNYQILIAGTSGYTSHKELFNLAVRYNYGHSKSPILIPKWISWFGVWGMDFLGRLIGHRPFEKPWMIKYIDTQMNIDSSYSRELLSWEPITRYHIMRRLLFLIENKKANPYQWTRINIQSLHKKTTTTRPNLLIYETMINHKAEILDSSLAYFHSDLNASILSKYRQLTDEQLYERLAYLFYIIKTAIRTGDRLHALEYARALAVKRFVEKFEVKDVKYSVDLFGSHIIRFLHSRKELKKMNGRIHDEITMTIRLICDEIEDSYERLMGEM